MIKISLIAILTTIAYVLFKQYKPEYAILVQIIGGGLVLLIILPELKAVLNFAEDVFDGSLIDKNIFVLLLKALGITIISQFAADTCRDNGVNALAAKIELAGKAIIIAMSLPMIEALIKIAMGMIK